MTERLHLTVGPRPAPDAHAERGWRRAEAHRLLALSETYFDRSDLDGSPTADFEDFIEDGYRLDAALASFRADEIAVLSPRRGRDRLTNLASGREIDPAGPAQHLPRYGGQYEDTYRNARWHGCTNEDITVALLADNYPRHDTFRRHAGREYLLAGNAPDDGGLDIVDAALQLVPSGGPLVVKVVTKAKYLIETVNIPAHPTRESVQRALHATDIGGAMLHLDGLSETFMVQERVPGLSWEYRVFVVDHRPVTAAGCIEEFTPIDREQPFDSKLREHRPERSPVENRPDIAARLIRFAEGVIVEYARDQPALRDYVIDVALDATGRPLVIELNGLLNAGLYASDPYRVTAAIRARSDASREVATATLAL